jgi:hypothetical protein
LVRKGRSEYGFGRSLPKQRVRTCQNIRVSKRQSRDERTRVPILKTLRYQFIAEPYQPRRTLFSWKVPLKTQP